MTIVQHIREGLEIVGSDGGVVGTVKSLDGQLLRLRRADRGPSDNDQFLDIDFIADISGNTITLLIPASEAHQRLSD